MGSKTTMTKVKNVFCVFITCYTLLQAMGALVGEDIRYQLKSTTGSSARESREGNSFT
jgi:hypothetical protein